MPVTREGMERAMRVQEVIVRGLSGALTWLQVADILGRSPRSIRRMRWRFEQYGYDGLYDGRRAKPSPKRAPVAEVERILRLYRERYPGFNGRHFYQVARREHAVTLSYTFVKTLLQRAGLLASGRARGRHRRRREPRPCFGELLHLDGSLHPWLALDPERKQTLITVVDDATTQLLYGQFAAGGESVVAVMTALRAVLERHGCPWPCIPIARAGPRILRPPGPTRIARNSPRSAAPCSAWASSTSWAIPRKPAAGASG